MAQNKADLIYQELVGKGYDEKDAAKEAQQRTGLSLVTGAPIRQKQLKFSKEGITFGQQNTLRRGNQRFGQFS